MENEAMELLSRLLRAAKAGECPTPDCEICKEKRDTIREAEAKLKEWRMGYESSRNG